MQYENIEKNKQTLSLRFLNLDEIITILFRKIAKELNVRGIFTQRGREWMPGTIHAILKNQISCFTYTDEVASRPDLVVI